MPEQVRPDKKGEFTMNDFLKNLRSNQNQGYNKKQYDAKYKGQQSRQDSRHKGGQGKDTLSPHLKGLLDDLVPVLKRFLKQTTENQARLAVAEEKKAAALEKISDKLNERAPVFGQSRKAPKRRKIDSKKQETLDLIKQVRSEGLTYEEVAAYLDKNNVSTFSGRGRWHAQTIHRLFMYYP